MLQEIPYFNSKWESMQSEYILIKNKCTCKVIKLISSKLRYYLLNQKFSKCSTYLFKLLKDT